MIVNFSTHAHGTLFNAGREWPEGFRSIMDIYIGTVTRVLEDKARTEIKAYLPTQYMYLGHHGGDPKHNPVPPNAGEYMMAVTSDRVALNHARVYVDNVIYGAWIEGDAPGNLRIWKGRLARGLPGRFPGYHAFRKEAQALQLEAHDIALQELPPFLAGLNA